MLTNSILPAFHRGLPDVRVILSSPAKEIQPGW